MTFQKFLLLNVAVAALTFSGCNTSDDDDELVATETTSDEVDDSDSSESDDATEEEVQEANNSISEYDSEKNQIDSLTTEGTITITWNGSSASVEGSADNVEVAISGSSVTVTSTTESVIEYVLQGSSTDGNIKLYSDHKYKLTLNGLTLTSKTTAAINNQSKKSLFLYLAPETTSTLADASSYTSTDDSEDCKGCIFSEGQIVLCGTGSLNVSGNYKHAIATDDYLTINQNVTLNINGSVKDAIHTNDYIVIETGNITIKSCGADGIESDEGAIQINGGDINITTTASTSKCIKAVGDITINGGTLTLDNSGSGEWDSTEADYSNASCIKTSGAFAMTDGYITATATGTAGRCIKVNGDANISGGTLSLKATGTYMQQSGQDYNTAGAIKVSGNMTVSGGTIEAYVTNSGAKAIKVAGTYTQTDGNVTASASGSSLGSTNNGWGSSSSYTSRAKGMKVTGAVKISGGSLTAYSKTHEAFETKSTLDISGGEVYGQSDKDDAINASSTMTINDGFVCAYTTANDGLDANGNLYIKGGVVFAVGASSPEVAIDANTEGGYKLYVQGGTIITVGPLESGASLSQSCYQASSWSKNTKYALTVGSDTYVFTTPSGSAGSGMVFSGASTPSLKSGVTVSGGTTHFSGVGALVENGSVSGGSTVSLSAYSGSSSWRR